MVTLTQLLGISGTSTSLGDTMYRPAYEDTVITRDDGTVFIKAGSLIPFTSEYETARTRVPWLIHKETKSLTLIHSYGGATHFFYANNKYFAVSSGSSVAGESIVRMSVSSNLLTGYNSISAGITLPINDALKFKNNVIIAGNTLNGTDANVKLGYINTTNNAFVTATALLGTVPTGILAANSTSVTYRGISSITGSVYSSSANSYYSSNGTTWTKSTSSVTLYNPQCFFWSPVCNQYIMAGRAEGFLINGSNYVLDEYGSTIPHNHLVMYRATDAYDWFMDDLKPNTTGLSADVNHQANVLYRYENNITTSNIIKYPGIYITNTPWQSLYANSPTVSLCSPGLHQAIVRMTSVDPVSNKIDYHIVDLSDLLDDPVQTTQRIFLSWDGTRFLAFYGSKVLYSPDGLTWTKMPHSLYTPKASQLNTTTTFMSVSNPNNRIVLAYYTTYSQHAYFAEVTDMYLTSTTPTYAGSTTGSYTYNSIGGYAYLYMRIK